MKTIQLTILAAIALAIAYPSFAVDIVYLKSGSTLVAENHKELAERVEVVLLNKAKIFLENADIDRIVHETNPPIQISDLKMDPEKVLPDVSDPLNWWLELPEPEDDGSSRLYLSFQEQIARGEELPLARTLDDVKFARKRKIRQIEFVGMPLHLGMDMQYHDDPGMSFKESFEGLLRAEESRDVKQIIDFISQVRASTLDYRKKEIIASAIETRDRLDPDYDRNRLRLEDWSMQVSLTEYSAPVSTNR